MKRKRTRHYPRMVPGSESPLSHKTALVPSGLEGVFPLFFLKKKKNAFPCSELQELLLLVCFFVTFANSASNISRTLIFRR